MKDYKVVRLIDNRKWWDFVSNHPQGNIFQSPDMLEQFSQTRNYKPVIQAVLDGEEIAALLLAVVQKEAAGVMGYFSSRTIVWGGPLIKPSGPETENRVLDILLKAFRSRVKGKSIYVQFRNLEDISKYEDVFRQNGFSFHEHLNYLVAAFDREETEKRISKSKMRQVRKSLKSGASIIEPANVGQVFAFYNILSDMYRSKVKKPLPDWSFFQAFFELSRQGRAGKYFLVQKDGKIIGGIMCPITEGKAIYEWYVCGLDGKYKGVYPSILATWAPIDYALDNGLQYFDFLGAGKPDRDYGVREFKSKFGGDLVKYGRFEGINNKPLYHLGKLGLKILGFLKK